MRFPDARSDYSAQVRLGLIGYKHNIDCGAMLRELPRGQPVRLPRDRSCEDEIDSRPVLFACLAIDQLRIREGRHIDERTCVIRANRAHARARPQLEAEAVFAYDAEHLHLGAECRPGY